MTPAEELAAAARKLEAMAGGATAELRLDDVESGLFPEDIVYIEAMNPLVGKALAEWLHDQSSAAVVRNGHSAWALEIARLINGGAS